MTDEQLELNRLISLTNESNLIKPYVEPKKDKYGRNLLTEAEMEEQKALEDKIRNDVIQTSFQNGVSELIKKNRFGLKEINLQKVQRQYKKLLKQMECEILQDNKKYIMMREIFNLVDPVDVK